jgi:uncharacterized membrane protein YgcG
MVPSSKWPRKMVLLAAVWLTLLGAVSAAPPEVRDAASFFSPAAVNQANAGIQEIKRLYKKDLHVETFPTPPANLKDQFQKNQAKAFVDWAKAQAGKSKIEGVYVLITKTPSHLEVLVDDATLKKAFPAKDRDKLRDVLLTQFREKSFDKGLAAITALTRERFEQNIGPAPQAAAVNVVHDRGQFFSPAAVARVNLEIKEFHQRFKKDLMIETYAVPPADKQKLLADANPNERNKIFSSWLHERAKEAKADGIVILICRQPARVQVEVSTATEKRAFTTKNRDELVGLLTKHFGAKEFDKALEKSLDFVYDTVDKNLSPAAAPLSLGTIRDNASLFSAAAVQRGGQEIQALGKDYRQTLTIETFAHVPPGQVKRIEAASAEERNSFFRAWSKERTETTKFAGIYVLICKQPGNLQVVVDDATQAKAFTPADRDELIKIMNASFQAKQFDQGLSRGLDFIQIKVVKNAGVLAIKDDANAFKAAALLAANRDIQALRRAAGQEILIETVASLPPDKKDAFAKLPADDEKGRQQLFADWQRERGKAGANGIHVLISQDPAQVAVAVDETAKKKFGPADQEALRDLLAARLKAKDADKGLTEATAFLRDTLSARPIQDEAGFFSPGTVEKANAAVRDLRRRFKKEVVVESFKEVPADRAAGVDLKEAAARSKFFAAWAEERRKTLQLDGVNILICKNPMNLQVAATSTGAFAEQRDEIAKLLLTRFQKKQYDAGLTEALHFIDETLQKKQTAAPTPKKEMVTAAPPGEPKAEPKMSAADNAKPSTQAAVKDERTGFDYMWIVWGLAIVAGLWLVIGILRALFGGRRVPPPVEPMAAEPPMPMPGPQGGYGANTYQKKPYPQQQYPQQQPYPQQPYPQQYPQQPYPQQQAPSGGGFMPSVLGGLFGSVAGSWIYDRFRGNASVNVSQSGGSYHPPATQAPPPASYHPPPADPATGYSSSGGDFGDTASAQPGYSSSGGDFGQPPPAQADYASSGGDFGEPAAPPPDYGSAGGDFGTPTPDVASSGGDFGQPAPPPDYGSAGGDFSAPENIAYNDASSGGNFDAPPEPAADNWGDQSVGGDFGSPPDSAASDWGSQDAGGGSFGGGDSGGGSTDTSGGDFGASPNES